jgi:hypothetical protein
MSQMFGKGSWIGWRVEDEASEDRDVLDRVRDGWWQEERQKLGAWVSDV